MKTTNGKLLRYTNNLILDIIRVDTEKNPLEKESLVRRLVAISNSESRDNSELIKNIFFVSDEYIQMCENKNHKVVEDILSLLEKMLCADLSCEKFDEALNNSLWEASSNKSVFDILAYMTGLSVGDIEAFWKLNVKW